MKKIEAIIKRKNFSLIKSKLKSIGIYIIDKRNLEDSHIYDELKDSQIGNLIPLAKIEIVVSNKDARKVVDVISKNSGLSSKHGGKIFVSEMEEVLDMKTLNGKQDFGMDEKLELPKRSRFVPLQKFTLQKLQVIYEKNKDTLHTNYRIKSFSDFVNYCIMKTIPTLEKQLKNHAIIYENNNFD